MKADTLNHRHQLIWQGSEGCCQKNDRMPNGSIRPLFKSIKRTDGSVIRKRACATAGVSLQFLPNKKEPSGESCTTSAPPEKQYLLNRKKPLELTMTSMIWNRKRKENYGGY